ncbi:WD repeat-containing protein 5-like protein, partial [Dipodascopsis tothii]|uniref:WD repeat-containing protein 5-like protein n=1 Tax=Dipodascopsis tothii TaxID=44089 RepID=UPI0034CD18B2
MAVLRETGQFVGHDKITAVKVSPDGTMVATADAAGAVKLWRLAEPVAYDATLEGHVQGVNDIAWSPCSGYVASGSDDKTVRIWQTATLGQARVLRGHTNHVTAVAYAPKGNLLASGSFDESVKVWDVKRGTCLRTLPAHSDPVSSVVFSADGSMVVSASYDGLMRLWDTATGQCLKTLIEDNNAPVTSVRLSPNGQYLLSATLDSCVRLWDAVGGRCIKTLLGHTNVKYATPAEFVLWPGRAVLVAIGSEDGRVVVWDLGSKNVVAETPPAPDVVFAVAPHPTRPQLLAGGGDGRVRLWALD